MTRPDLPQDPIATLASLAREAASAPISREVHQQGRERILAAAAVPAARSKLRRGPVVAITFAAALAAAAALAWMVRPSLRYEVSGAVLEGPYVGAPSASSAEVRFSDGSKIEAEPQARLRVAETSSNGARVFVEKGATHASVVHDKASKWTFVAGPFEVRVTGTRFDLAWDPQKEEIDLTLLEGSVEVNSPLGQGPIAVRKGQRFRATVPDRSMTLLDATSLASSSLPAAAPPAAGAEANGAEANDTESMGQAPAAAATPPPLSAKPFLRRETWQELVGRGEFDAVVAAANARGVDTCISGCSLADLRSLAEAARYTSRSDLAERSLLSLRQRFPGTGSSVAAAFLLGRTFEASGQWASAERWYSTYGSEAADGEFAAEALAGKMRAIASSRGASAAKPIALEYLARYPKGVHVKTARKMAGLD
jgi:hypothetical protein